ncbi:4-hydroxy-tetrahydrodipicolinate reductase [bacterium BMS3Abin02]|nr:4-hydroxy-tetrahydrodipicolinate reductase [bacterium BMS3Abin02]
MLRVGVSGAAGRMGGAVAAAIGADPEFAVGGLFDPAGGQVGGMAISTEPDTIEGCDVVVEFTNPAVVMDNLATWRRMGVHAVVGTSGFTEERIEAVRTSWGGGPPNCLIVPNFSIGAVLMMRFAELAAPHFDAAEIVELHHDRKADAPSGTAAATASRIAEANPEQRRAVESSELVPGARGASIAGVPVHAVRLPGLLAHQEVLFGAAGEVLRIRHDTTDRSSFLPGVLLAVRGIGELPGVTVGLDALL